MKFNLICLGRVLVGKGNVISYSNDSQDFDLNINWYILEASAIAPYRLVVPLMDVTGREVN